MLILNKPRNWNILISQTIYMIQSTWIQQGKAVLQLGLLLDSNVPLGIQYMLFVVLLVDRSLLYTECKITCLKCTNNINLTKAHQINKVLVRLYQTLTSTKYRLFIQSFFSNLKLKFRFSLGFSKSNSLKVWLYLRHISTYLDSSRVDGTIRCRSINLINVLYLIAGVFKKQNV